MIHQPIHLLAVTAYGVIAVVTFVLFVSRVRGRNIAPVRRFAGWLLLCMSIGMALFAGDEWIKATQWPPIRVVHWSGLHWVGSLFVAMAVVGLMVGTFRYKDEDTDKAADT